MIRDTALPSKHGGDRTVPTQLLHRLSQGWIAAEFLDLEKSIAYQHALKVTEIRITRQGKTWRLMVKGTRHGNPVVSFENIEGFSEALEWLVYNASSGQMTFIPDKWPVKHLE